MNTSRFIITVIVVWVVYFLLGSILNGAIIPWQDALDMKTEMSTSDVTHKYRYK